MRRLCWSDKAKIADEEDTPFINSLPFDALEFLRKRSGQPITQIDSQRGRTHCRAIVKLHLVRLKGRTNLAPFLEIGDRIDEPGICPRFSCSTGLCCGDQIRRSLFNYAEAVKF
jgi:hypothetical protein